jgi:hypothetical protein
MADGSWLMADGGKQGAKEAKEYQEQIVHDCCSYKPMDLLAIIARLQEIYYASASSDEL